MEESDTLVLYSVIKRSQNNTLDIVVSEATFTAVTNTVLPACSSYLESLRLDFNWSLNKEQLSQLLDSLRSVFQKDDCSLNTLTLIFVSCYNAIVLRVLSVCPTLKHLTLEIIDIHFNDDSDSEVRIWNNNSDNKAHLNMAAKEIPDLCLETLRVRSCNDHTFCPYDVIVSKCPNLRSLDLTGIYCTPELFLALADSNQPLKVLKILDSSLDHQHQEIIQLLEHSELEELSLIDVGVGYERRDGNKDIMESLVAAVKKVSTLRTLTLSLNTLTGCTVTTAKLFEEPCPSQITKLDLRRNDCRTEDLLKFAELMSIYKPTQQVELNLPIHPLVCEPEKRLRIVRELSQYCDLFGPHGLRVKRCKRD